jgi:hypothetical protein
MKPVHGQFTRFEFENETEAMAAMALTPAQRAHITNEMAIANERILELQYDPLNPMKFIQEDAGLKGQSAAYNLLLTFDTQAQEYFAAARQEATVSSGDGPDSEDASNFQTLFPQS